MPGRPIADRVQRQSEKAVGEQVLAVTKWRVVGGPTAAASAERKSLQNAPSRRVPLRIGLPHTKERPARDGANRDLTQVLDAAPHNKTQ